MTNFIFSTDSYKMSHYAQYPKGVTRVNSYIEARGGSEEIVFFGMQAYIQEYLIERIKAFSIYEARVFCRDHGVPFRSSSWRDIKARIKAGKGLPIEIYSVDEGTVLPAGNVLVQIRNTDPEFFWLTSWLETQLLRAIWYPTTVATQSREMKKTLEYYLKASTGSTDGVEFMLQDFGARGVSSSESAGIGGAAHLVNFLGSDNMEGAQWAIKHYGEPEDGSCISYSVPASEHSTMTAWGRDNEVDACANMLDQFGSFDIVSVVSDSYDIYKCVDEIWGDALKDAVNDLGLNGGRLVVRPDSGPIMEVPIEVCERLMDHFGYTTNEKGFRVLPDHVRVLQGDGLNAKTLDELCSKILDNGLALSNFVFGMGGGLLQGVTRDTYKFAMKASAIEIDGSWVDVYKDPIHSGKKSKKGILRLCMTDRGILTTVQEDYHPNTVDYLKLRYRDGEVYNTTTFDEIRERAK